VTFDEVVKLVGQVGFPIVVAGYLMIRMERTLRQLVSQIERLVELVTRRQGERAP
jgi:hypothetical protein